MDVTTTFWFALGLIGVLLLLQVLAKPLEVFMRVLGSSLLGGAALWIVNLIGGWLGFHLGLNPASAAIVGVLGVPGFLGLAILRVILG